jgi:hypothetical protein
MGISVSFIYAYRNLGDLSCVGYATLSRPASNDLPSSSIIEHTLRRRHCCIN